MAVSPHRHERPDVRADMAIRLAYLELRRPASVFSGRRVSMKRARSSRGRRAASGTAVKSQMPFKLLKYGLSRDYPVSDDIPATPDLRPAYDVVIVGGGGHGLPRVSPCEVSRHPQRGGA